MHCYIRKNPEEPVEFIDLEASTLKARLTNITAAVINHYVLTDSAADVTDVEAKMK